MWYWKFNESTGQKCTSMHQMKLINALKGIVKLLNYLLGIFDENDSANEGTKKWVTRNFETSSISVCLCILNDHAKFSTIIIINCTNVFNDDKIGEVKCR